MNIFLRLNEAVDAEDHKLEEDKKTTENSYKKWIREHWVHL